jgi:hypothetical protein
VKMCKCVDAAFVNELLGSREQMIIAPGFMVNKYRDSQKLRQKFVNLVVVTPYLLQVMADVKSKVFWCRYAFKPINCIKIPVKTGKKRNIPNST